MGYPRNTREWTVGDTVIHAGDAKEARMLMRIVKIKKDGDRVCKYLCPEQIVPSDLLRKYGSYEAIPKSKRADYECDWVNDLGPLLNPRDFGIEIPMLPREKRVGGPMCGDNRTSTQKEWWEEGADLRAYP